MPIFIIYSGKLARDEPLKFPDDLKIPPTYYAKQLDLDGQWQPIRVFVGKRFPIIEFPDGVKRITDRSDILVGLNAKYSLTICPPGEFDALLRWFTRTEIFGLELGVGVWVDNVKLWYRGSTLRIGYGNRFKYIINLWNFFTIPYALNSLDEIAAYIDLLLGYFEKSKVGYSSLASLASVSRHLLTSFSKYEFIGSRMDREILKAFYLCSHGGRQDSTGLGTMDAWNYDMNQAHLGILAQLPTFRRTQYYEDFPFIPEAAHGAYLINVTIPRMILCPLPFEVENTADVTVAYPFGDITGWYAKPYLELLRELGIPFSVIKSHQYVPVGEPKQPFTRVTRLIRNFYRNAPSYINAKGLYYGIAGSTIAWRRVLDEKTGEIYPRAFNVFNPLIYSHVLAAQSVRVFREVSKGGAIAIRSDAVTTRSKLSTSLRLENSGPTTFITALFKAFPSGKGELWHDLLEQYRDKSYVEYEISEYPTIRRFLNTGRALGKLAYSNMRVKPSHGKRNGLVPLRIGDLLTAWLPSTSPSVDVLKSR